MVGALEPIAGVGAAVVTPAPGSVDARAAVAGHLAHAAGPLLATVHRQIRQPLTIYTLLRTVWGPRGQRRTPTSQLSTLLTDH